MLTVLSELKVQLTSLCTCVQVNGCAYILYALPKEKAFLYYETNGWSLAKSSRYDMNHDTLQ